MGSNTKAKAWLIFIPMSYSMIILLINTISATFHSIEGGENWKRAASTGYKHDHNRFGRNGRADGFADKLQILIKLFITVQHGDSIARTFPRSLV